MKHSAHSTLGSRIEHMITAPIHKAMEHHKEP